MSSSTAAAAPTAVASPATHPPPVDVHRILAAVGAQGARTKAMIALALGGIFMDAYDFSSITFGITGIKEQFGLNGFMTGLVNASIMNGAVVGAIHGAT